MAACLLCRHFHSVTADEPPHELLIPQRRFSVREGRQLRWICSQCGRVWMPIDGAWEQVDAY